MAGRQTCQSVRNLVKDGIQNSCLAFREMTPEISSLGETCCLVQVRLQ